VKKTAPFLAALLAILIGISLVGVGTFMSFEPPVGTGTTTKATITATTTTATTRTTIATDTPRKTTTATSKRIDNVSASHIIKNVPLIKQFPAYPTGCETISTMMVLQYWGENVSTETFIDTHLEKSNYYQKDGKTYGPNPYDKFVGDPRNDYSLGCFAPVIERALISYFGNSNHVINTTGLSMDTLCAQYVQYDIPVLVWVSIYMEQVGLGFTWYDETNGEKLQWRTNEHCMVLVGYDKTHYYFNDPYSGKQLKYAKSIANDRHQKFECQSIVVTK